LITDISQSRIDIIYTFKGAELLVFGAIQYANGQVPDEAAGLVVVMRGPAEPITVRKKARVAGIWVNTASVRFESAPGFYAVATSAPIAKLVDERTAAIWEIGVSSLQLSPTGEASPEQTEIFERGLIDQRRRAGLFAEHEGAVGISQNILYRARIAIPSTVPVGSYTAQIFLVRKGEVIAQSTSPVEIDKSGFERWIFVAAHNHAFLYGLAAVALALLAGWGAGLVVRLRS
ncbi:MAG: TIGR02186 family protein, partial [Polymorphobacter sp.]